MKVPIKCILIASYDAANTIVQGYDSQIRFVRKGSTGRLLFVGVDGSGAGIAKQVDPFTGAILATHNTFDDPTLGDGGLAGMGWDDLGQKILLQGAMCYRVALGGEGASDSAEIEDDTTAGRLDHRGFYVEESLQGAETTPRVWWGSHDNGALYRTDNIAWNATPPTVLPNFALPLIPGYSGGNGANNDERTVGLDKYRGDLVRTNQQENTIETINLQTGKCYPWPIVASGLDQYYCLAIFGEYVCVMQTPIVWVYRIIFDAPTRMSTDPSKIRRGMGRLRSYN